MSIEETLLGLNSWRRAVRDHCYADEPTLVRRLIEIADLGLEARTAVSVEAAELVRHVRAKTHPTVMESFLSEYGLSTDEGVGLMCLAEALLRVPDDATIDDLISDKIEPGNWASHLGKASSLLVNATTWALMLTGKVLDDDAASGGSPIAALRGFVKRVGEPVVRVAVGQAMRILGEQFVLGETIEDGVRRANEYEAKGYTYSYDMLGEAARTADDAERYYQAYLHAIRTAGRAATGDIATSPGVSIKLSALHPRYEWTQRLRIMDELVPRVLTLAEEAARLGIGLNVDAEEANRLELSLDVIERVLASETLQGWDGFGVVVQAYGRRALQLIDWLAALADQLDRRIMVRLVKGAYWDTEIKQAQVLGLEDFPVFTRKVHTDISYLACARKLIARADRIYAQFATHNAHTAASVLAMQPASNRFEFQRLHGMGEALHDHLAAKHGTRCRIYAPVGAHEDLLAYLVRRLLENGANSSFVNQIVDEEIPPENIAQDPISEVLSDGEPTAHTDIRAPSALFGESRRNAIGFDVNEPASIDALLVARDAFTATQWRAAAGALRGSISETQDGDRGEAVYNPARPEDQVGLVATADADTLRSAIDRALTQSSASVPVAALVEDRATALARAADLYEAHFAELCALCAREAGKTLADAIAEVREAVDFLRYYAGEARRLNEQRPSPGRGAIVCISPWNFPLAIFTGQVAAALAAGNSVLAKPAEQTPLIAARAVGLLQDAGISSEALQLLPGDGPTVGAPLTASPTIAGVCFTGSTEVAQLINRALISNDHPDPLLIAETGGLNAMIVDSTALPEQAVRDIVASAFQSAGQRCSALRVLYVQADVADRVLEMLFGAMDELVVGDPWDPATDVGPVIDLEAKVGIVAAIDAAKREGRLLKEVAIGDSDGGLFVAPTVIQVSGIGDVAREIFGPVLHVATFEAEDLGRIVGDINARGYGLTFGLHTRIDDRVDEVVSQVACGNVYVNRNQIGAIVGSQPFGGEGLSGTGPKAGGPDYVDRFRLPEHFPGSERGALGGQPVEAVDIGSIQDYALIHNHTAWREADHRVDVLLQLLGDRVDLDLERRIRELDAYQRETLRLPGPTGETNRLTRTARHVFACLGPNEDETIIQAALVLAAGNGCLVASGHPIREFDGVVRRGKDPIPVVQLEQPVRVGDMSTLENLSGVLVAPSHPNLREVRCVAAERGGPIISVVVGWPAGSQLVYERHLCVDTTAAGGNAALLASTTGT